MGESRRVLRVEKELQQVIANFVIRGIPEQPEGLLSVSAVSASKDLRNAKVYVSVMGSEESQGAWMSLLEEFTPEIQNEVNRKLRMKFCPKLRFIQHHSMDEVLRIEGILNQIKNTE